MTSTKVMRFDHTHVVFNMRHNEIESLQASLCHCIACVTFFKTDAAVLLFFFFFCS